MMVPTCVILEVFQGKSPFPQESGMLYKGILWFYFVGDCLGNDDHEIQCLILQVRRVPWSCEGQTLASSGDCLKEPFWRNCWRAEEPRKAGYSSRRKSQKAQEQGSSPVLKDELVGNTSPAEQRTLDATQEKEESLKLLEEGAGSLEGVQGCCEVLQG